MAVPYQAPSFTGGIPSGIKLTQAFADIETALESALSINGDTPNAMEADLDLNGNDIINVGSQGGKLLTSEDLEPFNAHIATSDTYFGELFDIVSQSSYSITQLGANQQGIQQDVSSLSGRTAALETDAVEVRAIAEEALAYNTPGDLTAVGGRVSVLETEMDYAYLAIDDIDDSIALLDTASAANKSDILDLEAEVALVNDRIAAAVGESFVNSVTPEMLGADGTVSGDTAALLACQADPRTKVLNGSYQCNADLQLVDGAKWLGNGSIEFVGSGFITGNTTNVRYAEIGPVELSRIGTAGPVISFGKLTRRIRLEGTRISSSTGSGIYLNGCYLIDWDAPYIVNCAGRAIEVEHNASNDTGCNRISLNGGEIQNCGFTDSVWAIYLEYCKSFEIDGTAIEGLYGGIEIGKEVQGLTLDSRYFEGCENGIVKSVSTEGQVSAFEMPSSTVIYQRTGDECTLVDIEDMIHGYIRSGVAMYADVNVAGDPLIRIAEQSNNRAKGYVGRITTLAPEGSLLHNKTYRYGKRVERIHRLDAPVDDVATVGEIITYRIDLAGISYPAQWYDMNLLVNCDSGGDMVWQVRAIKPDDSSTEGTWRAHTTTVVSGVNQISLFGRVHNAEWPKVDPKWIEFRRVATDASDTAGDATVETVTVITYENGID